MRRLLRRGQNNDRLVAVLFGLIVLGGLIFDAAHAWFWRRGHDSAPVAGILVLLLGVALLRRHRFAWWIFLIVSVAGLPSWVVQGAEKSANVRFVVGLVLGLAEVALLFSVPMRRYVGIGRWRGQKPFQAEQA